MTNLLLKRLATKGYLRIKQLNRKKVEYLLTPRGLAEKGRKTYHYTMKTIQSLALIKEGLQKILNDNLTQEIDMILIEGEGDLAEFTALVAKDLLANRCPVQRAKTHTLEISPKTLILDTNIDPADNSIPEKNRIPLLKALSVHVNLPRRNGDNG